MSGSLPPSMMSMMMGPGALPQGGQRPLFADAPVIQMQPGQPAMGGTSPLAQALMAQRPDFQLPPPNFGGNIPLASMMMGGAPGQGAATGIGNLLNGYSWDGIPGSSALNALSQQAAGNIAAGAPGL